MELFNQFGIDIGYVIIGVAAAALLELILIIVLFAKNSGLKKKYKKFMTGAEGSNLEKLVIQKFERLEQIEIEETKIEKQIKKIEKSFVHTYQKMGIVKYDAFKELGGQLSFALALLDKEDNGFLLNAMHSTREGCYTYVKEIIHGEASVVLSEEEKEALEKAKNGDQEHDEKQ